MGVVTDLYSIGDHTLSDKAVLMVPEDDPDLSIFQKSVNVKTYNGYRDGITSNDLKMTITETLRNLNKPILVTSGHFLDEPILSMLFNGVQFPTKWSMLSAEQLNSSSEFQKFNLEKLRQSVLQVIDRPKGRVYVCTNFDDRVPKLALFEENSGLNTYSLDDLKEWFKSGGIFIPQLGVSHNVSFLHEFEKTVKDSYRPMPESSLGDSMGRLELLQILQVYIEAYYRENRGNARPPLGFYEFIDRVRAASI